MSDPWVQYAQSWFNLTYESVLGVSVAEDGYTGWQIMYALTRALQYELGISPQVDNFGSGTLSALTAYGTITATHPSPAAKSQIIKIAQAAMYCKGYNAANGVVTGYWDSTTRAAMTQIRNDLGLSGTSSDLTPKLFKFLLTMDAAVLLSGGDAEIRAAQRAMNSRYLHRADFYCVPADGYFLRDTHRAMMFAIQYELGLADGVANGNLGPMTRTQLQAQAMLNVGSTDTTKFFVHLFNLALRVNGAPVTFSGSYTSTTATHVSNFQSFVALPVNGTADLQTWSSLLVSTGDPSRPGTGADTAYPLTSSRLSHLRSNGYIYFGRYLTNATDHNPDKDLQPGEAAAIFAAGGRLFPLFQTGGGDPAHFTTKRAREVAEEAACAAWHYRIPANTVIYFSVDYDAYDWEVTDNVIPYFQVLNDTLSNYGRNYRVGVYGPRNVCKRLQAAGLSVYSFVSDMSTGYSGNLGHTMPTNWSFDQITTLSTGTGSSYFPWDKNIVSGRDPGIASLAPLLTAGNDPLIRSTSKDAYYADIVDCTYRVADTQNDPLVVSGEHTLISSNAWTTRTRYEAHDALVTNLASQFNMHKALILTPFIWESMMINPLDLVQDERVLNYYNNRQNGTILDLPTDCSTGVCQIFAATAIRSRNWAVSQGLLSDRLYDAGTWQDMFEMWSKLRNNDAFNITTCMYVMMYEAATSGYSLSGLRDLTPSEVMHVLGRYNDHDQTYGNVFYGRKLVPLYYEIQRAHASFR